MTTWTGTAPTLVAGDTSALVTKFNDLRDATKANSEAWTAYTPTWTGATTNPVLNNGSFSGSAYAQIGKLIHFRIVLTMGSTTTYGSGGWSLTLPVAPKNAGQPPIDVNLVDTGGGYHRGRLVISGGLSAAQILTGATTAGNPDRAVTSTAPFTWANTDVLTAQGTYEAA